MIDLSEKLIELREKKGVTQLDISEILGTSFKIVSKWEQGEYIPNVQELKELADFYNIPFEDFIEFEEEDDIEEDNVVDYDSLLRRTNKKYFKGYKILNLFVVLNFYFSMFLWFNEFHLIFKIISLFVNMFLLYVLWKFILNKLEDI